MPPRRFKTNHRGGGGGGGHVASVDDVKARNKGEMSAYDKARATRSKKPIDPDAEEEESEEESEEEQKPEVKEEKKSSGGYASGVAGIETANPNAIRHVDKEGVELTRKQREELDKQAARRRYEELHKAGKTDEAKSDLARLEEVKKRREEAKKRAEDEAKAKEVAVDAKAIGRAALTKELKDVMGTDGERVRGSKKKGKDKDDEDAAKTDSSKKVEKAEETKKSDESKADTSPKKKTVNGVDVENAYSFVTGAEKVKEQGSRFEATDGTIEACREAEADFM